VCTDFKTLKVKSTYLFFSARRDGRYSTTALLQSVPTEVLLRKASVFSDKTLKALYVTTAVHNTSKLPFPAALLAISSSSFEEFEIRTLNVCFTICLL
jgi:hypothetical protein